jgi:multidrug efflux pump subunit AcrB
VVDGELATSMIRSNRLVGVRVRYPAKSRSTVEELQSLLLTSPTTGTTVPLSSIAKVEVEPDQTEIHREDLLENYVVSAQVSGRDLGSVVAEIRSRLPREVPLPPGTEVTFGGLYQIQHESFVGLAQVLVASVLLIFVILVFEFRSFAHPLAIVAATLLCSAGALAALLVTGSTLNVSSFMGVIMVVGIVHKNGILMLDSEQHHSARGLPLEEAIFEAGRRRLRPILMTALATISGMLPLALNLGQGAQLLRPLAIAVIGGVAVSMLLSLLVTPVLFSVLRRRI